MIKLKDLLVEAQTFNFNKSKTQIMRLIKKIRDGESLYDHDNPFYTILRNDHGGNVGIHKKMGFKDDVPQQWKNFFQTNAFNPNGLPVWSQRDFNPHKKVKQDGKTYGYYITVDTSDKNNVARFVNNYIKLDNSLKQFSDKRGVAISYKTHGLLDVFLTDNDSLKVYYYDPSLKSDVENIVKQWAKDNSINLGDRSHTHGIDIEDKGSYGIIIAQEMLNVFVDTIKKHPNHSDEEYYQWIVKNFVDIIKSIKVK
jgi:hypothetical protein